MIDINKIFDDLIDLFLKYSNSYGRKAEGLKKKILVKYKTFRSLFLKVKWCDDELLAFMDNKIWEWKNES
ncbi:hypothetical protein X275_01210 [Marinitoga sp. 1197]|uniref:hypothetical protein n=1 Tax=Marinitoga sp. 1197 TaxID=1428449 RepID=UPI0006410660|nr:hypothetical protein [Marinitoga sp. 1197]AJW76891.1 hypothetical protein UF08_2 [Marinitoga camini virus 1]KLO24040.1 hypothetical protein X275_01210 [Marinitoga sp. 1197]